MLESVTGGTTFTGSGSGSGSVNFNPEDGGVIDNFLSFLPGAEYLAVMEGGIFQVVMLLYTHVVNLFFKIQFG